MSSHMWDAYEHIVLSQLEMMSEHGDLIQWWLIGVTDITPVKGSADHSAAWLGWCYMWNKAPLPEGRVYIKMHTGWNIKYSHSDWGGEFLSQGTQRELTVHDSPPQNGVSQTWNVHCAEQAQAMLISSGLPHYLCKSDEHFPGSE